MPLGFGELVQFGIIGRGLSMRPLVETDWMDTFGVMGKSISRCLFFGEVGDPVILEPT